MNRDAIVDDLAASIVNSYADLEEGLDSQVVPLRIIVMSLLVAAGEGGSIVACLN